MKKIIKVGFVLMAIWMINACSTTELDLLDNPNEITPDNAELDLVFNNVMYNFGRFVDASSDETMPYVRMTAMTAGNQYRNQDSPASFNFIWGLAYSTLYPDIDLVVTLSDDRNVSTYKGIAKIVKAYTAMTLVDLFGDVPYSEAGQGAANPNPKLDSGAEVYAAAMALLEDAKNDLASATGTPAYDPFYDGDAAKWIKAANSMIIRANLQTRLVSGSSSAIDAIVSSGDFISSAADDFAFRYGTSRTNPDSRHPYYSDGYETGGPSWYMSNSFMRIMFDDPRQRYYFYRQDCDTSDEDQFTLSCASEPYPSHWPSGYTFCVAGNGYWGRDHGDDSGIPPDDLKRTAFGLYPAGGKFDGDDCKSVDNMGTDGALGAGIQPVILSSFVHFMLAEAALTMGVSGDAAQYLEEGVRQSISKVLNFDGGVASDLAPTAEQVDEYVGTVMTLFNAASGDNKLNIVMTEYYKALFGNGLDAYNNYRRTGMPLAMQPTLEVDPGPFARSMWYPLDFVELNSTISSNKANVDVQVFWDTNPAGFIK